MTYQEFFTRFGASLRTKHLTQFTAGKPALSGNKRSFLLPPSSGIPAEFIRLEPWEAEYLFMIASRAKKGIVETGRYHGGSVFLMGCANTNAPIYSVDISPQNDGHLKQLFNQHSIGHNIELIVGDSQKTRYPQIKEFDALFIDGDHSHEGCTNDLENWFPLLSVGGHVILHDCYFGCAVQDSVIDFISRNKVQVVQFPYIPASHWFYPAGSFTHFIKLA